MSWIVRTPPNTPPPSGETKRDYETDPRPFSEIAKAWAKDIRATRAQAAESLGVSIHTYNRWCDGSRVPDLETATRRLMTYIARDTRHD